jgi:hypothetical protein
VQATQFAIVSLVGLIIRTPLFAWLEAPATHAAERLAATDSLPLSLSADAVGRNLALAVAVGVVLVWNFLANRFWTYSDAP